MPGTALRFASLLLYYGLASWSTSTWGSYGAQQADMTLTSSESIDPTPTIPTTSQVPIHQSTMTEITGSYGTVGPPADSATETTSTSLTAVSINPTNSLLITDSYNNQTVVTTPVTASENSALVTANSDTTNSLQTSADRDTSTTLDAVASLTVTSEHDIITTTTTTDSESTSAANGDNSNSFAHSVVTSSYLFTDHISTVTTILDYSSTVTDFSLTVTDFSTPDTAFSSTVTDFSLPVTDFSTPVTDFSTPVTDFSSPVTDFSSTVISVSGSDFSLTTLADSSTIEPSLSSGPPVFSTDSILSVSTYVATFSLDSDVNSAINTWPVSTTDHMTSAETSLTVSTDVISTTAVLTTFPVSTDSVTYSTHSFISEVLSSSVITSTESTSLSSDITATTVSPSTGEFNTATTMSLSTETPTASSLPVTPQEPSVSYPTTATLSSSETPPSSTGNTTTAEQALKEGMTAGGKIALGVCITLVLIAAFVAAIIIYKRKYHAGSWKLLDTPVHYKPWSYANGSYQEDESQLIHAGYH